MRKRVRLFGISIRTRFSLTSLNLEVDGQDCLILFTDGHIEPVHTVVDGRLATNRLNSCSVEQYKVEDDMHVSLAIMWLED